jgi:hypothetical protein
MQPGGSLPKSHEPFTGTCPEPDQSNHYTYSIFTKFILILSTHVFVFLVVSFSLAFPGMVAFRENILTALRVASVSEETTRVKDELGGIWEEL